MKCLYCDGDIIKRIDQSVRKYKNRKYCSKGCFNSAFHSTPNMEAAIAGKFDVIKETGCWIWKNYKDGRGYGSLKYKGKEYSAHRFSYLKHKGEIPKGAVVMHMCNDARCINPDHLKVGTQKENVSHREIFKTERFGENHANSKLKESDVVSILNKISLGSRPSSLAREYNVTDQCIHSIRYGKSWKHLTRI